MSARATSGPAPQRLTLKLWFIQMLSRFRQVREVISREYTDSLSSRIPARPHAFSLWSHQPTPLAPHQLGQVGDYTSWRSLVDRTFSARHLPPAAPPSPQRPLPDEHRVAELWRRPGKGEGDIQTCERSSVLFAFFAQWFTDSILRTHPDDRRKNTSTHDIDLCQIYGLDERSANALRAHQGGKLATLNGQGRYPDRLLGPDGSVKPKYTDLSWVNDPNKREQTLAKILEHVPAERSAEARAHLYATGLERGNSSIGYVALSTIFLREHNRLCDVLAQRYPATNHPDWDDERLFQTARNINIVILLKILIEDYINHIIGHPLFLLDPTFAGRRNWYRPNWIALEFNLLYRWHGLMPSSLTIDAREVEHKEFRNNNRLFESIGLPTVIETASCTRAGKIGLLNTPRFLIDAELASVKMSRAFRLRSYNDYREHFGLKRLRSFDELTNNRTLAITLADIYQGDIERLEYLPGVFGEAAESRRLFGELMSVMVAYDAFTQIYSNPLIAETIFNRQTFTEVGLKEVGRTASFQDLVNRNLFDDEKCQHPGTPLASLKYVERNGQATASAAPAQPEA